MTVSPKTIRGWVAKIEKQKAAIGRERDKLRDILDEMEGLKESCETAYDDLQRAADSLSELV